MNEEDNFSMNSGGQSKSFQDTDPLYNAETALTNNEDLKNRMTQGWKEEYKEEKIEELKKELSDKEKEELKKNAQFTEQPICETLNIEIVDDLKKLEKEPSAKTEIAKEKSKMTMISYNTLRSQDSYDFAIKEIQYKDLLNMIQNKEPSKVKIFKIKISASLISKIEKGQSDHSLNAGNHFIFLHSEIIKGIFEKDLEQLVRNMMKAQVFYFMSQENIRLNFQNLQLVTDESLNLEKYLCQQSRDSLDILMECAEVETNLYLQNQRSKVLHWGFQQELDLNSENTDKESLKQDNQLNILTTSLSKILKTDAYVFKTIRNEDQQSCRAHYYDLIYENQINVILNKCVHLNKVSEEIFYIDENSEIRGYYSKSPVLTTITAQIKSEINSFDVVNPNQPVKYCDVLEYYFFDLLRSICCIHAYGFSHGDIKPDNILIDTTSSRVKVADLGTMINFNKDQKEYKIKGLTRYYASASHTQSFDSGNMVTEDELKAEDRYQLVETMKELDEYMHKLQNPEQTKCNCQIKRMISDIDQNKGSTLIDIYEKWRYDANIQSDVYQIYKLLPNFKINFDFYPYYDRKITGFLQNCGVNKDVIFCCFQDTNELKTYKKVVDKGKHEKLMLMIHLKQLRDFIEENTSQEKPCIELEQFFAFFNESQDIACIASITEQFCNNDKTNIDTSIMNELVKITSDNIMLIIDYIEAFETIQSDNEDESFKTNMMNLKQMIFQRVFDLKVEIAMGKYYSYYALKVASYLECQ